MRPRASLHANRSAVAPVPAAPEERASPPPAAGPQPRRHPRARLRIGPEHLLALAVALAGLVLRLRHNDYGLPYVYNVDEGAHFTNRAVAMFGGDLDPGYFQNPSGFTYLVHGALRLRGAAAGSIEAVPREFREDPTAIYVTARSLSAVLGVVGVLAVFAVGRRLWGAREGVLAATVLAFAFLPVAYSRIAVTDVGTLAPVALAVLGAIRVAEGGGRRWFVAAGVGVGLAIGFKYTAGLVLLPLLAAAALRRPRSARMVVDLALGLAAAVAALFATTPFLFLEPGTALAQLREQAELAGESPKLGQGSRSGVGFYLGSLTWGLGWLGCAAALVGAGGELRRRPRRAVLLALFPLALLVYLSLQTRSFGRWLLPTYPLLALLCAVGLTRLADLLPARPWARVTALAALAVVVLAQPVAADLRTAELLGRPDTREEARAILVARFAPELRVVVEPAVPRRWFRPVRDGRVVPRGRQFVPFPQAPADERTQYTGTLRPELVDRYRRLGFCTVVVMSVIRGRAENDRLPRALAYYRRLERESRPIARVSPYRPGAEPVGFDYDRSYLHEPPAFGRPGPDVAIRRLDRCRQRFGPVAESSQDAAAWSEYRPAGASGALEQRVGQ